MSDRSPRKTSTDAPGAAARIRSTVTSAFRGLRATIPTWAPRRASSTAAASPMPLVAPVTIITCCSVMTGDAGRRLLPPTRRRSTIAAMSLEWEQTVVDALEPRALADWWRDALGWVDVGEGPASEDPAGEEEEYEIRASADRLPGILFIRVPESKEVKNRLHFDFRPDDRDAEVERLLGLGATRVDIGQGDVGWIVLADPEGNEFCVLSPRRKS